MIIHLDYEVRSRYDLMAGGSWNYSMDPSTSVMCVSYAFDDGPVRSAHPAFPAAGIPAKNWPPGDLIKAVLDRSNTVHAHNSSFEKYISKNSTNWLSVEPEQWRCTLSVAAYYALPRGLEKCALALGLPFKKDMKGNAAMRRCMRPNKNGDWHEDREDLLLTFAYCDIDVEVERAIEDRLGQLPPYELAIWQFDQKMNERGIPFDRKLAEIALETVEREKAQANIDIYRITEGMVETTTARNTFFDWTEKMGYPLKGKSLDADHREIYLADPKVPDIIKEVIKLKASVSAASVNKYKKMLNHMDEFGVVREGLRYFGAGTGRWAGMGVQVQNFPRGYSSEMEDVCDAIVNGDFDYVEFMYGDKPMGALKKATRGAIKAPEGKEILVTDYSSVEARGLFWFVDDLDAIEALKTACIYCDLASGIFGYEVIKGVHLLERQFGKQGVLGCFDSETLVYTDSGLKKIVDIDLYDKVWDGVEWVDHAGVKYQGWQRTLDKFGLEATPHHEIFTGESQTKPFQELGKNTNILKLALKLGHSSLKGMLSESEEGALMPGFPALVTGEKSTSVLSVISIKAKQLDVTPALKKKPMSIEKNGRGMQMSYQMTSTEGGYSIGFPLAFKGATTQRVKPTSIMGREAYEFLKPGGTIGKNSFDTLSALKAGINQNLNLTELMSTEDTSPATSDLSLKKKTLITDGASQTSKQKSETWSHVYDVVNAGPRSRFMIHTNEGPLIVHNCGYQMGFPKFFITLEGYKIELPDELVIKMLGDKLNEYKKAVRKQYLNIIKSGIDFKKNFMALVGCKFIVDTYRTKYSKVKDLWKNLENDAVEAMQNPGVEIPSYKVKWLYRPGFDFLQCIMPSGRCINYFNPELRPTYTLTFQCRTKKGTDVPLRVTVDYLAGDELEKAKGTCKAKGLTLVTEEFDTWENQKITYMKNGTTGFKRTSTYGGKLTENIIQGICRDILAEAMIRVNDKFPVNMTIHDEACSVVDIGADMDEYERILCILPKWAKGFPVGAESFRCKRYKK